MNYCFLCMTSHFQVASSRLRDSGEKSRASYFRFARFNTSALYYLRAWHRLTSKLLPSVLKELRDFETFPQPSNLCIIKRKNHSVVPRF